MSSPPPIWPHSSHFLSPLPSHWAIYSRCFILRSALELLIRTYNTDTEQQIHPDSALGLYSRESINTFIYEKLFPITVKLIRHGNIIWAKASKQNEKMCAFLSTSLTMCGVIGEDGWEGWLGGWQRSWDAPHFSTSDTNFRISGGVWAHRISLFA